MIPDFSSARFKTSSYTDGNGTCVEVATVPGSCAVRDTKHRAGGHLTVSSRAFRSFLARLR
ncbi:DUF397 domain-containing protein [Actinosynnema sp. NPDC023587]|uniref:DUF397 domain-containing protein n=1 Tax=Actinosynnema sp. NPDC023587 TaxID=3154695 RepID=UPI0033E30BE4